MIIEQLRVLNGPNYWSGDVHQLIVVRVDLENLSSTTKKVKGLCECLEKHLLESEIDGTETWKYMCGKAREGTSLAHIIELFACALQKSAGHNTAFSCHRNAGKPSVYHVVFSYRDAASGQHVARRSIELLHDILSDRPVNIKEEVEQIKAIHRGNTFGPSTGSIVEEAVRRNIPIIRLDDDSLVQLGYGCRQKRIEATIASTTSSIAVELAGDKSATKKLLNDSNIPVPAGGVAYTEEELTELLQTTGYPVVLKPRDGNQGKGATTNVQSLEEAMDAFRIAQNYSKAVICERHIDGYDYRALVINYQFVAAAMRKPASVTGDGRSTIWQLVEAVNRDPKRGDGHENVMTKIKIDESTNCLLRKKGYTMDTVLGEGEECFLKSTANLSTGGTATDVTDNVHPTNIAMFNRIARLIGLDICGIDIVAIDLSQPLYKSGGAIIEVNAAPGFRMHLQPSEGTPRNVAAPVLDMLFPDTEKATIPIIGVTGTNGKTTTTRLLAHMCMQRGIVTGCTTTEGIYIQDQQIESGDCSGPHSAEMILRDPSVEIAVLECARGGILKGGLAFKECDTAIVTNIAEDHLGLNGIMNLDDLANVKSVVPKAVKKSGYVILNADDDLVYAMKDKVKANIALFSIHALNPRVIDHCKHGGLAAVYANDFITIIKGDKKVKVEHASNIPMTFNGRALFNIANILGAVLAAYTNQFPIKTIREALVSFDTNADNNPGRMNIFNFRDYSMMIDYAHNPHGMKALGKFIESVNAPVKTGIIAGVGDRRDEDLVALGEEAGKLFDEIIVRMDDSLRGRTQTEIYDLLVKGIDNVDSRKRVSCIPNEEEAIRTAIANARPGTFIVALTDRVSQAIEIAKQAQRELESDGNVSMTPVTTLPLRNVAV